MPELDWRRPIFPLRICEGGKAGADELFVKMSQGAHLISTDKLKKLKIYKLDEDTYMSYREDTKYHSAIIEIHFPEIEKNLLFKF